MGTAVAQWLRCCATNQKVAGLIAAGVSGFFIDIKFFRLHYGPGVDSASNRNEYQEYFLGLTRLTTYHHPVLLSRNLGTLTSWNPLGLLRPVTGLLYLLPYCYYCLLLWVDHLYELGRTKCQEINLVAHHILTIPIWTNCYYWLYYSVSPFGIYLLNRIQLMF